VAKYVVPGVPQGAQRYKQNLQGSPGTTAIGAPTSNTQISPDAGDKAQMGTARSSDSPDVWYPTKYYQADLEGAPGPVTPVRIWSDNLMPVPAVDPRGVSARLSRPVNQRGHQQIKMPRAMPLWGGNS
jgi:hypothetical protein